MPWCPKCRNEYVEGKTHCPDCDVDLVEELSFEKEEILPPEDYEFPEDFRPGQKSAPNRSVPTKARKNATRMPALRPAHFCWWEAQVLS